MQKSNLKYEDTEYFDSQTVMQSFIWSARVDTCNIIAWEMLSSKHSVDDCNVKVETVGRMQNKITSRAIFSPV